jgi:hypothetical protein
MTSPNPLDVLSLFRTVVPKAFFLEICKRLEVRFGSGIYNMAVVVWLMILQRLQAQKTLLAVVQSLRQGQALQVLGSCKRVREGNISPQPWWFLPSARGFA